MHQAHEDNQVTLHFFPETEICDGVDCTVRYTVTTPDGRVFTTEGCSLLINSPQLWWPNGYGAQPLYTVLAELLCEDKTVDTWQRRIGLRTMTIRREKDPWGESFETCVNGVSIFAMGADYISEDSIRRQVTPERTRRLLADAAVAQHNAIRVWGGGYYPDDWFFDAYDELGLVVWQDFMFACAMYELWIDEKPASRGAALFCAPKHFHFADPQLRLTVKKDAITATATAYARSVEIICEDGDVILEDNYFDLNAESRRVRILRGKGHVFTVRSVYDIGRERP